MSTKLKTAGSYPSSPHFLLILIGFFIAVSSLKTSQISDNPSIILANVAMNIDNSSMAIAVSFHFFIAKFQCELNPGDVIGVLMTKHVKL